MDDRHLQFLYSSISDIQSTIRATDTKVGALMIVLLVPVSSLGKVFFVLRSFYKASEFGAWKAAFWIYAGLFSLTWLLAFLAAFRVFLAIHNPREHIKSAPENGGRFYRGGLFKLHLIDVFRPPRNLMSSHSVKELAESLPSDLGALTEELVFEQMKLAYIRDIKAHRQNWAYNFAFIWLALVVCVQQMIT